MRFVKAVSMVAGVAVLFAAVNDVVVRRADRADELHRTGELAAVTYAARLDAAIARSAAVLAVSSEGVDVAQAGRAAGAVVCVVVGDATDCGDRMLPAAALPTAVRLAATADELTGTSDGPTEADVVMPLVEVVIGVDDTAIVVLVALARPDDVLIAAIPVGELARPDSGVTASALIRDDAVDAVRAEPTMSSAVLETEFTDGRWAVVASPTGSSGLTGREYTLLVIELAIGAVLVVGALTAMSRDRRGWRRRATTDSLTGLPNRFEFERRATAVIERADRPVPACLLLVDLDGFKSVNDTVGHAGGDRVLVEAARRLRAAVRDSDLVARWGGDEFVLLLIGVGDPAMAATRAAAIGRSLAGVPTIDGAVLTATVGTAMAPYQGGTLADLLAAADAAMYSARATARSSRRSSGDPVH